MAQIKTQYKFIKFSRAFNESPYPVWVCQNSKHGYDLGMVAWYPPWKQFCYSPNEETEYSSECLRDIADFCEQLNKAREG